MSQAELGHCLGSYGDHLERQMVAAYEAADAQLLSLPEGSWPGVRELHQALQPSQIAFEAYRTAHCDLESLQALGASGTVNIWLNCRNGMTEERIEYLRSIANFMEGV